MTCSSITGIESFADLLVWPTICNLWFYLPFLLGLLGVLSWRLFKAEDAKTAKGDFISSLAVSSIATTVIAGLGTLVKNTAGLPMIPEEIILVLLAITIPAVLIWMFKE